MKSYNAEQFGPMLDELIADGLIEPSGVDDNGEILYSLTDLAEELVGLFQEAIENAIKQYTHQATQINFVTSIGPLLRSNPLYSVN